MNQSKDYYFGMGSTKMIKITCYNKEYVYETQQEAFNYFMDCYRSCDKSSNEASRYSFIIMQIADGKTIIKDEEY